MPSLMLRCTPRLAAASCLSIRASKLRLPPVVALLGRSCGLLPLPAALLLLLLLVVELELLLLDWARTNLEAAVWLWLVWLAFVAAWGLLLSLGCRVLVCGMKAPVPGLHRLLLGEDMAY